MSTPTLTIGLLGAGRIGKVHAAAIAGTPGARLVAVADALPEAATTLAAAYDARVASIDDIIGDDAVDAVFITTPTDMHSDLIEQAAVAGKAIFCEKPIDLSVDRVRQCLGVVAEHDARLMVGFNRRFDPNFRADTGADRCRRHRRCRDGVDHVPRPWPAAARVHGPLGWAVP